MYDYLSFDDQLLRKVKQDLSQGKKLNHEGKIEPIAAGAAPNTPWIFISKGRHKFCGLYNHVMTQQHGLIPTYCRFQCWKTVIKPRNCKELFMLFDTLTRLQLPSKCGMDLRDYSYGAWAGFVYACSLPEGRRYHKRVLEALKKTYGEDQVSDQGSDFPGKVVCILKRGCTEMEALRTSTLWDQFDEDELTKEKKIEDMYAHNDTDAYQSDWVKNSIKERWIKRAIEIGDPTAREMAEKYCLDPDVWSKLVVHSETYHDKPGPGEAGFEARQQEAMSDGKSEVVESSLEGAEADSLPA